MLKHPWRSRLTVCALLCAAATAQAADGLAAALQATLKNHPAMAGQRAMVEARTFAMAGARSQRYPTVSAQAQQYRSDDRTAVTGEDLSQPVVLSVRQPLWSFGRIKHNIAAAAAGIDTERADLVRLGRELLESAAVAYADVQGDQQQIEIARANVGEHEALLAQIQRRLTGQLASSADERLAATRLAQARGALQRAISKWEGSLEALGALTQVAVGTEASVPEGLLALNDSNDLVEVAVAQSAEVQLKAQQVSEAEAEVRRARTAAMPTLYLQADKLNDQPALVDDNQVSLVFEASLDGLGFAARSRTGEAQATHRAAEQDLAATKLAHRQSLERLQRNRRLQTELIDLQTQSLDDLTSLLASYQRQYERGTKSWLDLMNIQRELYEQRQALAQARSELMVDSLKLQARTGGLDALAGLVGPSDG